MKIAQNTVAVIVSLRVFTEGGDTFANYAKIQKNTKPIPQGETDFSNILATLTDDYSFEVKVNGTTMTTIDFDIDFDADGLLDNHGSFYYKISNLR